MWYVDQIGLGQILTRVREFKEEDAFLGGRRRRCSSVSCLKAGVFGLLCRSMTPDTVNQRQGESLDRAARSASAASTSSTRLKRDLRNRRSV